MILEIEYWKYDVSPLLMGKTESIGQLRRNLERVETLCDQETDNFIPLFCRMFQWEVINSDEPSDYIYDRDVRRLIKYIQENDKEK